MTAILSRPQCVKGQANTGSLEPVPEYYQLDHEVQTTFSGILIEMQKFSSKKMLFRCCL